MDTAGLVRDVADYDGIVAMGGDGILYEMLQTLWEREDAECLMARMKFGIVGCGTSNGLVAGLLYDCGVSFCVVLRCVGSGLGLGVLCLGGCW